MKRSMVIAALAVLALTLSGCSSSAPIAVVQQAAAPTSQQDFDVKMNACMAEQGWDAIQQADGSFSYETTDEQADLFLEANSACLELIGANLEPVKSDDEWRAIYESLVEVHECLNTQGLDLPAPRLFRRGKTWNETGAPTAMFPLRSSRSGSLNWKLRAHKRQSGDDSGDRPLGGKPLPAPLELIAYRTLRTAKSSPRGLATSIAAVAHSMTARTPPRTVSRASMGSTIRLWDMHGAEASKVLVARYDQAVNGSQRRARQ